MILHIISVVKLMKRLLLLLVVMLIGGGASASHMIGGDITYRCLGNNIYEITITLFQDCLNGDPLAISLDNPAFYAIYRNGLSAQFFSSGSIVASSTEVIPPGFSNECITNFPNTCLKRQVFVFQTFLPPAPDGYTVVYQRCCRNDVIQNIVNPGNIGVTYSATIPAPGNASSTCINNSAVFNSMPPQIICNANPFECDFSATDPDGDSLSYELCQAYRGGSVNNDRPADNEISSPPFPPVPYLPPYSAEMPMSGFPPLQIDPVTGQMTITPNAVGRYVVSVCVHEWRDGSIINTITRDVQFVVTNCSKAVVANMPQFSDQPNTYLVECDGFTVHFVNTSTGGFDYLWDFGDGNFSTDFEPVHTYADTGIYSVKLVVNQGTTCPDSIVRLVKIFPEFKADFDFNDIVYCPHDTVHFTDRSVATYPPIVSWKWNFGDSSSSELQNPAHAYASGGTYPVQLIATTVKGCIDTVQKQVNVDYFDPYAGNDTIIVLDYPYQLSASGGDFYQWSPPDYLSNANIPNPAVDFPDTGRYTYVVHVSSEAGCTGSDTIMVWVVKDGGILMPNAFSPNGDGINDVVRPLLVGFTKLNYFRIFNRWGAMVYSTESMDGGWDGSYNGVPGDISTYYWVVSATDINGNEVIQKGDLILLR